jgi:hypothetical protein
MSDWISQPEDKFDETWLSLRGAEEKFELVRMNKEERIDGGSERGRV